MSDPDHTTNTRSRPDVVWAVRALLLLLSTTGCWSAPAPAPPKPVAAAVLPALPPCPVRIDANGVVFVNDVEQELVIADYTEGEPDRLAIYQTGAEAFLGTREREGHRGPLGSDTLLHVGCDGTKLGALTIAGANLGHAALHPDRRRLFYSGGAVMAIDLVTRAKTRITTPPKVKQCWEIEDVQLADTVISVTSDHVDFSRGGPCAFEGDYDGTLIRRHLATGVEQTATPIVSVTDVGREVWLSTGVCASAIYRSSDWKSWTRVPDPGLHGPITVIADRARPGTLVAVSGVCGYADGGSAAITRDGGKTWVPIDSVQSRVQWVKGRTLAELEILASGTRMRWKDGDFVELEEVPEGTPAPRPPTTVTVGGRVVELTAFGLLDAKSGERLFPR